MVLHLFKNTCLESEFFLASEDITPLAVQDASKDFLRDAYG